MKLRQKLAMTLAAAMIVTTVPVVTMAASTNTFNKTIMLMEDDVLDIATGLNLNINIVSSDEAVQTTFYVQAEDFEFVNRDGILDESAFEKETGKQENVTIEVLSETELKVTTTGDMYLPIVGTVTGEMPEIIIDGSDSVVSSGKYALVDEAVSDKALVAVVDEPSNISVDGVGSIADITIQEVAAGRLNNKEVTFELERNSDLVFDYKEGDAIAFKGERGFAGLENTGKVTVTAIEDETMTVKFTGFAGQSRGNIVLTGMDVVAENFREGVSVGEVEITIESDDMKTVEAVVANIKEYGVELTILDDEAVEFIAGGESQTVEITLEELAAGSLDDKYNVYFTVEHAEVIGWEALEGLSYDEEDEEFTLDLGTVDTTKINEYKLELELAVAPGTTEDIIVKAESRGFEETLEVVAGTVTQDRTLTTEAAKIEVGVKGQVGGVITLAEEVAETFEKGEILVIQLEEEAIEDGVRIRDFEVAVEGDLEVEKAYIAFDEDGEMSEVDEDDADDNVLAIKVTRESDEASAITISQIEIDTNNATPQAKYNVVVGGTLMSDYEATVEVEDFIIVGEDVVAEETVQTEASFKLGDMSFVLNGQTIQMDGSTYMTSQNRVMVPVRYVSQAFGILGDDLLFSNENGGTITIFINGKVLQLVNGSNVANMNGVKIPMQEAVTIKEGRTYIPMGEVARLLDVDVVWDNDTKTATFNN